MWHSCGGVQAKSNNHNHMKGYDWEGQWEGWLCDPVATACFPPAAGVTSAHRTKPAWGENSQILVLPTSKEPTGMFRDGIHGRNSCPLISVLAAIHVFQDPYPHERPWSHHSCSPKTGHAVYQGKTYHVLSGCDGAPGHPCLSH